MMCPPVGAGSTPRSAGVSAQPPGVSFIRSRHASTVAGSDAPRSSQADPLDAWHRQVSAARGFRPAYRVIERMWREKQRPTRHTYHLALRKATGRHRGADTDGALAVLRGMLAARITPDAETGALLMRACAKATVPDSRGRGGPDVDLARSVWEQLVGLGVTPDAGMFHELLVLHARRQRRTVRFAERLQ